MTYENHSPHISRHYTHAKEKHPHFADEITQWDSTVATAALQNCRSLLESDEKNGKTNASHLLDCETREAMEAYCNGDIPAAIEECYDAVAVLLRMVDMMQDSRTDN